MDDLNYGHGFNGSVGFWPMAKVVDCWGVCILFNRSDGNYQGGGAMTTKCGCKQLSREEIEAIAHEITPIERIRRGCYGECKGITAPLDDRNIPRRNERRNKGIGEK